MDFLPDLLLITAGIAVVGMALLTILCLFDRRSQGRGPLRIWVILFLGALALLAPGSLTLNLFGLAWRSRVVQTLVLLVGGAGLGVLVQTFRCFRTLLAGRSVPVRGAALAVTGIACALVVLLAAWLGLLLLIFSWSDRVVTWEGQTVVEVDESFPDPLFRYFDYHGPIVRGSGQLGLSTHPAE